MNDNLQRGAVEIYRAGSSVEAHCICQMLEEAGIKCQVAGEYSPMPGIGLSWNSLSLVVSQENAARARETIAEQLPQSPALPDRKFRYGLKTLLIAISVVAFILGFYRVLGPRLSEVAMWAFMLVVSCILLIRTLRRPMEGGDADADER